MLSADARKTTPTIIQPSYSRLRARSTRFAARSENIVDYGTLDTLGLLCGHVRIRRGAIHEAFWYLGRTLQETSPARLGIGAAVPPPSNLCV